MIAGVGNRFRRLGGCDRLLLLLTGIWTILSVPGNYFRLHLNIDRALQLWTVMIFQYLWILLMAVIAGVVAYTVVRQQRRPADYGFSINRGGVASLAVFVAIHVYLVISGKLVLSPTGSFFLLAIWGAFMEELVFRAIAIDKLKLLMDGIHSKSFWAIMASSALWLIPHIPVKSPSELLGIFTGGLFFGYVYYKTNSILLPASIHAVANAGYWGGIWIAGSCCLISFADWAIWSWNKQTPPAVRGSRNTGAIHSEV